MITTKHIGRLVWANDNLGRLERVTKLPDGREIAVVSFNNDRVRSEQVFPADKVIPYQGGE